jgi:predicted small metal-binding protein
MKEFSCGDVIPGCNAHFTAHSDEGIFVQVATHAAEAHGMTEVPASVVDEVRRKIRVAV